MTDPLADAAAELYQVDPDEFMPLRHDLVARAREAGQTALAKQIAGLRKPTRSAWAVNRLVRAEPEVAARLAALAAELREAERSGSGARIRELSAARVRLVDELTRQALSELPAPPAALREEVTATFDAALADPGVAQNLGSLVRAAHWAGFGLAPARDGAPEPPARNPKPRPAEAGAERERRQRENIMSAEGALAQADAAMQAANEAEHRLEDTVRQLEAELAQAREQLAEARRQAYRAESQQRRASEALGRLRA